MFSMPVHLFSRLLDINVYLTVSFIEMQVQNTLHSADIVLYSIIEGHKSHIKSRALKCSLLVTSIYPYNLI